MTPDPSPTGLVREMVTTALSAMIEHVRLEEVTQQDGINIGASLLVTLAKNIELQLSPDKKLLFRASLAEALHKMADTFAAGAYRFDAEGPEVVH